MQEHPGCHNSSKGAIQTLRTKSSHYEVTGNKRKGKATGLTSVCKLTVVNEVRCYEICFTLSAQNCSNVSAYVSSSSFLS